VQENYDNHQAFKKKPPLLSALLSPFVGAGVIFYALWVMNFDSWEWFGISPRVAEMGTGTAIRRRFDTKLPAVRGIRQSPILHIRLFHGIFSSVISVPAVGSAA
jgi:hypothetical protein